MAHTFTVWARPRLDQALIDRLTTPGARNTAA